MSSDSFIFPYNFQDLTEESTDRRYRVNTWTLFYSHWKVVSTEIAEFFDDRKVQKKLSEIERELIYSWNKIRDPNIFDFLYLLIRYCSSVSHILTSYHYFFQTHWTGANASFYKFAGILVRYTTHGSWKNNPICWYRKPKRI